MAGNDWTCYRRNYFSLNCSYTLTPQIPTGSLHIIQHSERSPQVFGFAVSIAAVVDGRDGKSIELVQHTPKRGKGPQEKPARIPLQPRPPPPHGMYGGDSRLGGSRGLYDTQSFGQNPNQPATEATFERIQFKNATANNGKRRAAQQYYHLLVELFADIKNQHPDGWIKIATRMSAPMVVRGRSPGYYQSERRCSNASTGPGGGGSYTPSGSASRTPGDANMSGTSMLPGSSYRSSYDGRSHRYRSSIALLQIPMEPTLSAEEAKSIKESPCYLYYSGAIYEGHEARFELPSVSECTSSLKLKQEYSSNSYVLPSLTSARRRVRATLWTMGRRRRIKRIFPDGIGLARVEHHLTVHLRYITTTLRLGFRLFIYLIYSYALHRIIFHTRTTDIDRRKERTGNPRVGWDGHS
jgi:meiosis-specific transcription factor NDT80